MSHFIYLSGDFSFDSAAQPYLEVKSSILIGGKKWMIKRIMTFKMEWISYYWSHPIQVWWCIFLPIPAFHVHFSYSFAKCITHFPTLIFRQSRQSWNVQKRNQVVCVPRFSEHQYLKQLLEKINI